MPLEEALVAAGSGDPAPFARVGLPHFSFRFERFVNPLADVAAIQALSKLIDEVGPDIVQCFDTKPNLLVPLAARRGQHGLVVRTINGLGWLFSSKAPPAVALRPVYCGLHRLAAQYAAATIFQNGEDPGSGIDSAGFEAARRSGPSADVLRRSLGLGRSDIVMTVATRHPEAVIAQGQHERNA